jgi:hypothetical protein
VVCPLTEPQAVAVYSVVEERELFKDDDIFLVVDAGGGTVDLCLVRLEDASAGRVELAELRPVSGGNVGSSYIDQGFEELALRRLVSESVALNPGITPEFVAQKMAMSADFQSNKRLLGERDVQPWEKFTVQVEHVSVEGGAINGQYEMEFHWNELKALFDVQIVSIKRYIDAMVQSVALSISKPPIKKIVHPLHHPPFNLPPETQQAGTYY